jgi:hypothetical protein
MDAGTDQTSQVDSSEFLVNGEEICMEADDFKAN